MIHLIFSNLKAWLLGRYHGVSAQHLPAYLNESVFRFNRRVYPMTAFASALRLGTRIAGPTYDDLYGEQWVRAPRRTRNHYGSAVGHEPDKHALFQAMDPFVSRRREAARYISRTPPYTPKRPSLWTVPVAEILGRLVRLL